ncbi:MAG: ComEC/Rec2 family competence protein [Planctomycetota bacterium]
MPPASPSRLLVLAALAAAAGVITVRMGGLVAAAGVCTAVVGVTVWARRAGPLLVAVPAALGAITPPPAAVAWPPPGPVAIDGRVLAGVVRDPRSATARVRLAPTGGAPWFWCEVGGELPVLPGDRVHGIARLGPQPHRRRADRPPVVRAQAGALHREAGGPSIARLADACRLRLQAELLARVPGTSGLLLCHLVLGRGPPLPQDLVDAHRDSGLAHLLAVSGAHASMLGLLLGLGYAHTARRSPAHSRGHRRFCAAFLILYGLITGLEPPVLRAVVAFCAVAQLRARGRRATVTAALALPALLTALLVPDDLLSPSFCLSYAAVIGLALGGAFRAESWTGRWLATPLRSSMWASLLTAPLTLVYFGQLAPWAVAGTPLLAPLVGLMLAGGIVVAILGLVLPVVADVGALPLGAATQVYGWAVGAFAALPGAPVLAHCQPPLGALLGLGLIGAAAIAARPRRSTVAALCVAWSTAHFAPAPAPPLGLTLLSVGHGQSALATLPGGVTVLVDCGSLGNPRRAARAAATALLPRRRLDWLLITHADFDHVGSVPSLLRQVAIRHAVLPTEVAAGPAGRALRQSGTTVLSLRAGQRATPAPGILAFRPAAADAAGANDRGLWVRLSLEGFAVWLPGDAEEPGVAAWLRAVRQPNADVLVLPHHGRAHALAADLLRAVRPRLALVSNRETTASAQAAVARQLGVAVLETGQTGDIVVRGDRVETEIRALPW